jgi:hypothetical protein
LVRTRSRSQSLEFFSRAHSLAAARVDPGAARATGFKQSACVGFNLRYEVELVYASMFKFVVDIDRISGGGQAVA